MRIVGLSCDYHDAAAALVVDGELIAAAEEERFSRIKHDSSLPERAVASCLAIGGIEADDVDCVVFHEKPLVVAGRVLASRQRRGPRSLGSFAREFPVLTRRNLMIGYRIESLFRRLGADRAPQIVYGEHHLSHAAAAFFPSPFDTAAILTIDGIGEWSTATVGHGLHGRVDLLEEQRYPNSLGLLYSLATVWCGFEANEGEYKMMGLAPFGEPAYLDRLDELVQVHDDGSSSIDARRVRWWGGSPEKLRGLESLFGGPPRGPGEPLERRHADLARSVQELTETAVMRMARHARDITGERSLCLAGGVALNCVANGRLLREQVVDDVWVQPASGDAGSAVGAALWFWHQELDNHRRPTNAGVGHPPQDGMLSAALGPSFSDEEVTDWLEAIGVTSHVLPDDAALCEEVAGRLADGAVIGWFQGSMEFGPRALGHRSILADPRSTTVQSDINLRVKGRESFRPFAPAVLWEHAMSWFEMDRPSPYMLFTHQVRSEHLMDIEHEPAGFVERVKVPRSSIPACTHIDGSARVQTVHHETNPLFHRLLSAFHGRTGCPVLLNTSFNRAGEPIVCTPEDALSSARTSGLDLLVIGRHLIDRPGDLPESGGDRSAA